MVSEPHDTIPHHVVLDAHSGAQSRVSCDLGADRPCHDAVSGRCAPAEDAGVLLGPHFDHRDFAFDHWPTHIGLATICRDCTGSSSGRGHRDTLHPSLGSFQLDRLRCRDFALWSRELDASAGISLSFRRHHTDNRVAYCTRAFALGGCYSPFYRSVVGNRRGIAGYSRMANTGENFLAAVTFHNLLHPMWAARSMGRFRPGPRVHAKDRFAARLPKGMQPVTRRSVPIHKSM